MEKGKNADSDLLEKEQAEREEKAKKEREAKKVKPQSLDEGDKAIIQAVNNAKDVVSNCMPQRDITSVCTTWRYWQCARRSALSAPLCPR